MTVKPVQSSR